MPTEELVTVEELKQRYVEDVIGGDDPDFVAPEVFPDAVTIRVAVTGDRPPMDYVSVGGDPIGFNTALIAEIAKKLGVNVEFVNVACAARGIALASGVCDIVFWMEIGDFENWEGAALEDQPEHTIVTEPYMSVPPVVGRSLLISCRGRVPGSMTALQSEPVMSEWCL